MYWRTPYAWGSVLGEVDRLRRGLDRLLEAYPTGMPAAYPAINLWANGDKLMLTAELPGLKADELDIAVEGRTLTLSGNPAEEKEKQNCQRRERLPGKFQRAIDLPYEIDADRIEARLEKGILAVVLPRAEHDKPKRIQIKAQ